MRKISTSAAVPHIKLISNLSKAKNEATAKGDTDTANKYEKLIQMARKYAKEVQTTKTTVTLNPVLTSLFLADTVTYVDIVLS